MVNISIIYTLPVKRLSAALRSVKSAFHELQHHLQQHPFAGEQEEIYFFKQVQPLFAAEQYYAFEKFSLEYYRPLTDAGLLKSYYEQELGVIQGFYALHEDSYRYYQSGSGELDQELFRRSSPGLSAITNPSFSTPGTELFARFMAHEKTAAYILAELQS